MATTNFNSVVADSFTSTTQTATINNTGGLKVGVLALQKAVDYTLTSAETNNVLIKCEMTAGSKTLTLGLLEGQLAIVKNVGATNAFTVENLASDTGTSLAAGKSMIFIAGSSTANTNTVIAVD